MQRPIVDWFDPDKPATANPETDWLIEIYDGRYVAAIYDCNAKNGPVIFGDLRQEGARFVAWFPLLRRNQITGGAIGEMARELLPYHRFIDFVADWEEPTKVAQRAQISRLRIRKTRYRYRSSLHRGRGHCA